MASGGWAEPIPLRGCGATTPLKDPREGRSGDDLKPRTSDAHPSEAMRSIQPLLQTGRKAAPLESDFVRWRSPLMVLPPALLDGARVLRHAVVDHSVTPTGSVFIDSIPAV